MASTLPQKDDMSPTYCPEKAQRLTEPAPKRTMSSRRLAVTFLLCFMVAYGLAAAISPRYRVPCHYGGRHHEQFPEAVAGEPQEGEAVEGGLSTLLNSVSPDSLHRMLHDYFPDRYQHGVYETDRQAVEAVHADNPAIVATMAQIAKRQNNSTSTTSSPPKTSSTTEKPTSTKKPTTTSSEESKTSTPTTTSKPPESTTTKAPETTVTPSSSSSKSSKSSTSPSSSSTSSSSSEPSSDSTTTSATPTRRTSSLVTSTFTSTQSNGDVTVVTATSFVEVDASATATTGGGSLQTGNAAPGSPVPLPAWAGVILGGLLLI